MHVPDLLSIYHIMDNGFFFYFLAVVNNASVKIMHNFKFKNFYVAICFHFYE